MPSRLPSSHMRHKSLVGLQATPHNVRHGRPSDDMYFDKITLKEVARRGRWHCLQSVRRYEKRGRLQKQVQRIPAPMLRHATALLADRNPAQILATALKWGCRSSLVCFVLSHPARPFRKAVNVDRGAIRKPNSTSWWKTNGGMRLKGITMLLLGTHIAARAAPRGWTSRQRAKSEVNPRP